MLVTEPSALPGGEMKPGATGSESGARCCCAPRGPASPQAVHDALVGSIQVGHQSASAMQEDLYELETYVFPRQRSCEPQPDAERAELWWWDMQHLLKDFEWSLIGHPLHQQPSQFWKKKICFVLTNSIRTHKKKMLSSEPVAKFLPIYVSCWRLGNLGRLGQ